MICKTAEIIVLTTKCSARCNHCPFSDPALEKLFLAPEVIKKIINQNIGKLTILSGGEPFEHPLISEILTELNQQTNLFRIATGGFINLATWIDRLKLLNRSNGPLQGISMGTDILSSRNDHPQLTKIWKNNINLLSKFQVPYSLTVTAGKDLEFARLNLWDWQAHFKSNPKFIYFRYSKEIILEDWIQKIHMTFGSIKIIQDEFFMH